MVEDALVAKHMLSSQDKAVDRVLESVLNILVSNRQGGLLCSEDACASAIRTRASSEGVY